MVGKFGVHDRFSCFNRDARIGHFHGFYVPHYLSFSEFRQTVPHRIPSERRYDGRVRGVGSEIEMHKLLKVLLSGWKA